MINSKKFAFRLSLVLLAATALLILVALTLCTGGTRAALFPRLWVVCAFWAAASMIGYLDQRGVQPKLRARLVGLPLWGLLTVAAVSAWTTMVIRPPVSQWGLASAMVFVALIFSDFFSVKKLARSLGGSR